MKLPALLVTLALGLPLAASAQYFNDFDQPETRLKLAAFPA